MGVSRSLKDDFLRLWRSILPKFYTEPIEREADGRGFDVPSAQAAIFASFEVAAEISQQAYYLRPHSTQTAPIARGAAKASGDLAVRRVAPNIGSIVVPVGALIEAKVLGTVGEPVLLGRYLVTSEVTIAEGDGSELSLPVEAEFQGYTGNIQFTGADVYFVPQGRASLPCRVQSTVGGVTRIEREAVPSQEASWDRFVPAMVGRYVRVVQSSDVLSTEDVARVPRRVVSYWVTPDGSIGLDISPGLAAADTGKLVLVEVEELEDFGVSLTQPTPIVGGRSDALGTIGGDRGVGRAYGELDDEFAQRIAELADVVSPAAIMRIADAILGPAGIGWAFKETADVESLMGFTWDVHPYDAGQLGEVQKLAGSELVGQGAVLLNESWLVRGFVICVGLGNGGEFGFAYDADMTSPPNAYDVTGALGGFYDGAPLGYLSAIARLWTEVDGARAAGVKFRIVRDFEL